MAPVELSKTTKLARFMGVCISNWSSFRGKSWLVVWFNICRSIGTVIIIIIIIIVDGIFQTYLMNIAADITEIWLLNHGDARYILFSVHTKYNWD